MKSTSPGGAKCPNVPGPHGFTVPPAVERPGAGRILVGIDTAIKEHT